MKVIIIVFLGVGLILIARQLFAKRSSETLEDYKYKVLKEYEAFEIRLYEAANFSYVTINSDSYSNYSVAGFRSLAAYIFGANDRNKKIAMTTPVTMEIDSNVTMKFLIPSKYTLDELPKPDSPNVKFKHESEKVVAAIRFGGWANDKRIEHYSKKLILLLEENDIGYGDNFSVLGYNPPYRLMNRRNEIIIEVNY